MSKIMRRDFHVTNKVNELEEKGKTKERFKEPSRVFGYYLNRFDLRAFNLLSQLHSHLKSLFKVWIFGYFQR